MKLLFVGPPGAGKGTQAQQVAGRLGIPHISTGEMFRTHAAEGTDLGKRVEAILASGGYVPDEVTVAMLEGRLARPDAASGFILDGFPRTEAQVEELDRIVGADGLDAVVVFEVDEEVLVSRLAARGRKDDSEATIRARLRMYREQTAPLLEIYRRRDLLVRIDGVGQIDEVTDRILSALSKYQVPNTATDRGDSS